MALATVVGRDESHEAQVDGHPQRIARGLHNNQWPVKTKRSKLLIAVFAIVCFWAVVLVFMFARADKTKTCASSAQVIGTRMGQARDHACDDPRAVMATQQVADGVLVTCTCKDKP